MQQFIEKYRDEISGTLSGHDRLILRGSLGRLNYGPWSSQLGAGIAQGMEQYLWQNKILFKDYSAHVKRISEQLKRASVQLFEQHNRPVVFLRSPSTKKDELARQMAQKDQIHTGLVCAFSSLEPSPTFEHRGTHIIRRIRPCHFCYHYRFMAAWEGLKTGIRTCSRSTFKWR